MLDQHARPTDEARAARELEEDLELSDVTAAEIAGGDSPAGSPSIANLTIMKPLDLSSPNLFRPCGSR
jgi:type VI protein secretion system component Hcp